MIVVSRLDRDQNIAKNVLHLGDDILELLGHGPRSEALGFGDRLLTTGRVADLADHEGQGDTEHEANGPDGQKDGQLLDAASGAKKPVTALLEVPVFEISHCHKNVVLVAADADADDAGVGRPNCLREVVVEDEVVVETATVFAADLMAGKLEVYIGRTRP